MRQSTKRSIRICGASDSALDRRDAFEQVCNSDSQFDVLIGDWLSEGNMPSSVTRKLSGTAAGYETSFLTALTPALPAIARKGIKVIVNAGASDPQGLFNEVRNLLQEKNLSLKVEKFATAPIHAQAYLGSFGITKALEKGADIIIGGRVADASLAIGAAIWWHGWKRDQLSELAAALVAGHLVECSTYVTGGNYSGFKDIPNITNLAYLIVEIGSKGEVIITIGPPQITRTYPMQQPSSDANYPAEDFGPTTRGPLGWLVHSRSGDKGANANVGFWARNAEEYLWLRQLLSISKIQELLGEEYKEARKIDRFELPGLNAVHFLPHNHLDRGINSTSTYDTLGKNLAEYLRARFVDLPVQFLDQGKV
ncbi:hypothetical protein PENVUL_c028G03249 [Penicillium vulpinum]|uniref:DUF1446 domain-containing protein n=1 Tax=Penicillium vulpinum TaxID=29845 RepID=A0A1V6RU70_9EURO|nr:hypothetical protein PENVUL_c028G03249 [Penicillium vulpinum]